jgi:hypothetical protein
MLTASRLRRLISYDRASGIMRWRVRLSNRVRVGDIAGSDHVGGYRKIAIDGRSYLGHVLAVLHVTGAWPARDVTFRNLDRSDCRWRNLRVA